MPAAPNDRCPLVISADENLLDDLIRLAAVTGVVLDVAPDAGAGLRRWASAPLVLVGADVVSTIAASPPPRRPDVAVVGRDIDATALWESALAIGAEQVLSIPDDEHRVVARISCRHRRGHATSRHDRGGRRAGRCGRVHTRCGACRDGDPTTLLGVPRRCRPTRWRGRTRAGHGGQGGHAVARPRSNCRPGEPGCAAFRVASRGRTRRAVVGSRRPAHDSSSGDGFGPQGRAAFGRCRGRRPAAPPRPGYEGGSVAVYDSASGRARRGPGRGVGFAGRASRSPARSPTSGWLSAARHRPVSTGVRSLPRSTFRWPVNWPSSHGWGRCSSRASHQPDAARGRWRPSAVPCSPTSV